MIRLSYFVIMLLLVLPCIFGSSGVPAEIVLADGSGDEVKVDRSLGDVELSLPIVVDDAIRRAVALNTSEERKCLLYWVLASVFVVFLAAIIVIAASAVEEWSGAVTLSVLAGFIVLLGVGYAIFRCGYCRLRRMVYHLPDG